MNSSLHRLIVFTRILAVLATSAGIPPQSEAASSVPDFGPIQEAVCPQLCIPRGSNPCTNPCLEKAKAEETFRKTSEYVQPSRISFPGQASAGSTVTVHAFVDSHSPCPQINPHLSHALIDSTSKKVRVRIAVGQKAEFCTELFVERELKTQLALSLEEKGAYEVITETSAGSLTGATQISRGFIEVE